MYISVVIPVLNEAALIAETIQRARNWGPHEIIVVDGGSSDGTRDRASAADRVLVAPRGRARQQNLGAANTTGDVLLFLHADCWLLPGAAEVIGGALRARHCVGGCFRQRIEAEGLGYRLLEAGNTARAQFLGWMYGDQALFVRRSAFEAVGGFPDVPLMEDIYFVRRLRQLGRLQVLSERVRVDPRRWRQTGVVRQTLRNWRLLALAHAGVRLDRLSQEYVDVR